MSVETIAAISGAIIGILTAFTATAVAIIGAIKGSARQASAERQAIAQGVGTQIERGTGIEPPNVLQPPAPPQ